MFSEDPDTPFSCEMRNEIIVQASEENSCEMCNQDLPYGVQGQKICGDLHPDERAELLKVRCLQLKKRARGWTSAEVIAKLREEFAMSKRHIYSILNGKSAT